MEIDWTAIFQARPDLAPPGYQEATEAAKAATEERYKVHGKKRAKGSNAAKPKHESRQAADARRAKYPSVKHSQQD